ncbi:MAG: protein translocase subunit SecD [Phycisphaerales bacterium]|nr:MAG: protein translocase subunit SecD [Phycisphaerales bacterium]
MSKNLTPKIVLIIVLVAAAAWTLYPPNKTLKPGIDLAGGTSLIYEIDTHGLQAEERKDLAQRMITVLRERIDPANIQNLVWRPQGNNRFEIQMPLASAEARQRRQDYEKAERELLEKNVSAAKILRSLDRPAQERAELFETLALSDPNRQEILKTLDTVHEARKDLRSRRDESYSQLEDTEAKLSTAGLDIERINQRRIDWVKLSGEELQASLKEFTDANDTRALLTGYVKTYADWSAVADEYLEKDEQYKQARASIDRLNLTQDQLNLCLEMPENSPRRSEQIRKLKTDFPDRAEQIDRVVAAFGEYRPFRGRLDDPKDLQRMLKGAGILEYRILPTLGHPDVDADQMNTYVERLKEKGPKAASDTRYVWCEIESLDDWRATDGEGRPAIIGQFGEKSYVLASNGTSESLLHGSERTDWKLEKSYPTTDDMGRRAIGFLLDDRGGRLFANVTSKNIDRPLCILLDGIAISAPNIQTRIYRQGQITGSYSQTEAEDMINKLNAGSLPARLIEQPISVNTIGPSIGADNRDQGIVAGLIGLVAVMLCMLAYYILSGSIADMALLMNILFVLAIMAGLRATFTLPGIAGIILTIGMSVDANVLVFERIREEQLRGSSLRIAIANGYQRAFRTILDANLTTFITAAILYWRASEEVKGFAIVLMLGIASSMFTALFVTRVVFDLLLSKRIIKDHLMMLRIIHNPKVNWMRSRPIFLSVSTLLVAAGLFVFFTRDATTNNKYDIEFTGGTNVQISLKEPMDRQAVEGKIRKAGMDLNNAALAATSVYRIGETDRQYEISTTETNKITVTVTLPQAGASVQDLTTKIEEAQEQFTGTLSNLLVTQDAQNAAKIIISTSQMNQSLVKDVLAAAFGQAEIGEPQVNEVVSDAILAAFAGQLEIQENLEPRISAEEKISEDLISSYPELIDFLGGVKIVCEIDRPALAGEIVQRFRDLPFKPDMRNVQRYPYDILDTSLNELTDPNRLITSFAYVSAEPEAGYRELSEDEWTRFVETEKSKVLAATRLETSLPRVRQFDPSVGSEQKTRALIAIVLSLFAIVTYIWIRFGDVRYGIAAIVALVHDVCITLGAVTACTYIAGTLMGDALLIGDFKINLAMIAAFLTLIGYSLNDTIVVFDRIRENRGKARAISPQMITDSINQTISRTILTSFTTFAVVLIMYIFGGPGLRGFNFAIGLGVLVGTYSSIAIAAPILLIGTAKKKVRGK